MRKMSNECLILTFDIIIFTDSIDELVGCALREAS